MFSHYHSFSLVLKYTESVHFRNVYDLTPALAVSVDRVDLQGHSFLACNLLCPCSLIDTELRDSLIAKGFISEVTEAEKQTRSRSGARHCHNRTITPLGI